MTDEPRLRRLEEFEERPIDGIYRRIQTMFVARTVLDVVVVIILVIAIVLSGSLSRQVTRVHTTQFAIEATLADLSARGYQSRAVSCIVLHATNPAQSVPAQCLDPKVLAQVPSQYRYD